MDVPVTGIALVDWFLRLLVDHAYLVVFAATTAENLFVVGSVTPGETVVMAGGFVSIGAHPPHPLGVFVASVLGSMLGTNVSYVIGRRGGRPVLERWGRRVRMTPERIRASEEYFERHGPKTVLIARFATGFKNYVGLIAGISRMRVLTFEAYVLAGSVLYSAVMVALGYFLGENFDRLLRVAGGIGWLGLALLVALLGSLLWAQRRRRRRRAERCDDV